MRIVLANISFEMGKKMVTTNWRRCEHIGIGYIGAMCEKDGHQVKIINGQYSFLSLDEMFKQIKTFDADLIGISYYESQTDNTRRLLKMCKELPNKPFTILGGHSATFNATKLIRDWSELDFVAIGECELSFPEFVRAIEDRRPLTDVKGFCFRQGSEIVSTGYPEKVADLDDLPYPIRPSGDKSLKMTCILASRGCYAKCSFCSTIPFYRGHKGKQIRARDPVAVVDEIEHVVKTQNAYQWLFNDDDFFVTERLRPGWIDTFVEEIEKRKLDILFNFNCRVDEVDPEVFLQLKRAGLVGVYLGVESNSDDTLGIYNKGTSSDLNVRAINTLRKMRIDCWFGNIMFNPMTTMEDIQKDIDFFETVKYHRYFNYSYPISCYVGVLEVYRGTPLHKMLAEKNALDEDNVVVQYRFLDERTDAFFNVLQEWKRHVGPLVDQDPIYMIKIANKAENPSLATRVHIAARKYMKLDFEVFCRIHSLIKDENISIDDAVRKAQELIDEKVIIIKQIDLKLGNLREEANSFLNLMPVEYSA